MDLDGPQAPGNAQKTSRQTGWTADFDRKPIDATAVVRDRVRAFVSQHGLSTLVGRRDDQVPALPPCDPATIETMAALAMAHDGAGLRRAIRAYIDAGWSNSVILLDLLAPTVRLLGEYWIEDRCDFATVTLGTGLIQRIVYELTEANRRPLMAGAPRALIAVTPGDQHSFGAVVLSELLRAAGWFVRTELDPNDQILCEAVENDSFKLVGLSLSRTSRIDTLRETIARVRGANGSNDALYFVGGRVFADGEATAFGVGADHVAVDAAEMIRLLDEISIYVTAD